MVAPNRMEKLVQIVLEDAEQAVRRAEDNARNEARRLVQDAQDRIHELRAAALDLGRVRGAAVDEAEVAAAQRELAAVQEGAFQELGQRFLRRVALGLGAMVDGPHYAEALAVWARQCATRCSGAVEVYTSRRDRVAVYEALLAAGVDDFHVRVDHLIHVGFIVRDLDGRTLLDRRPEALIQERQDELIALLREHVPALEGLAPLVDLSPAHEGERDFRSSVQATDPAQALTPARDAGDGST